MSGTFYRTYRPQKFSELVGQELIRRTLAHAVIDERIAHAYLFTGPRGTGKTTTARILAKAINCLTPLSKRSGGEPCNLCNNCISLNENKTLDLIEIDAASYTGVDNIRQLTENIDLSPANLRYRVFIIDEVHMLSKGAFNALLKTLEEPPAHTVFILATTEQHKVPLTIASRCQRFSFRLLSLPEILKKLKTIAKKEKIEIDDESLDAIGETASGGMRDAESLFAQVATLFGKKIRFNETREILGIAGKDDEIKLLELLIKRELSAAVELLDKLGSEGFDAFLLSHRLLQNLRKILLLKVNPRGAKIIGNEISEKQVEKLGKLAKAISSADLLSLMAKIVQAQPVIKSTSLPHLPLELVVAEWRIENNGKLKMPACRRGRENGKYEKQNDELNHESRLPAGEAGIMNHNGNDLDKESKNEKPSVNVKEENTNSKTEKITKKSSNKKEKSINSTPTSLKSVLSKWTAVLQNVREAQPALFSLLKVCSPVRVEDETLIIATPFKFHKNKLNDGRNKAIFCQELEKVVGLKRICVVEDKSITNGKVNDEEMLEQVKDLLG